jgi:hypothetical protein
MEAESPVRAQIIVPTIDMCDSVVSIEPHEPPIGFDSGSCYMSWNEEIYESSTVQGDSRPHKHTLKHPTAKGSVAIVRVITEQDDGKVNFRRYLLPSDTGAQVHIWLEQLRVDSTSWPFVYEGVAGAAPAQILITGNPLLIETDRELHGPVENYKNNRHFGYEHPGYRRSFRIAGWAILDSSRHLVVENNSSTGQPFRDFGQDSYKIYISFHD